MKQLKHLLTVALASVLALLIAVPAFAASDNLIKVEGLESGDAVKAYQVIKWDTTTAGAGKWVLTDDFKGLIGGDLGATEDAVIEAIAGKVVNGAHVPAEFTMAKANTIAGELAKTPAPTPTYTGNADGSGVWQKADPAAGLYMVVVTATHPNIVYNPIFVGADYIPYGEGQGKNKTNEIDAEEATYIGTGATAVAKKTEISVTKTAADAEMEFKQAIDSKVGETVNFKIETTLPVFLSSYTERVFNITDEVTDGIELNPVSIEVTVDPACDENAYTVTPDGTDGFTVEFTDDFLASNTVPRTVTVEYSGKITNAATFNLNYDNNTVTVDYSNGPDGETGALKDITNHYTFSLGAQLLKTDDVKYRTYELVKVGVDEDGEWVVDTHQVSEIDGAPTVGYLGGAVFGLYTDEACTELYKNDLYPDGATFETKAETYGVITFNGLAEGTYWLKEISAPAGYVGDTQAHKVEIVATYSPEKTVPAHKEGEIWVAEYKYVELTSFSVIIDGKDTATSTYTVTYNDDDPTIIETVDPEIKNTNIENTPGVELPSTGGIGTTIFYVVGGAMVLCGIVMFITKRRIAQIEE